MLNTTKTIVMPQTILLILSLCIGLSACQPTKTTPKNPTTTTNPQRNAAHNERVLIPFEHALDTSDVEARQGLEVMVDGKATNDYSLTEQGILLNVPADTTKKSVNVEIKQGASHIEQPFSLLSSFSSPQLNVLVQDMSEQELRVLLDREKMTLIRYHISGGMGNARIDIGQNSHKQALQNLKLQSQQLATEGTTLIASSDFNYKPVMHIHSLDPSCDVLPHLDELSQAWKPLYSNPEAGQASLWEILLAERAWNEARLTGKGTTIYIFDSLDAEGNDIFDCDYTPYEDGHGSYIKTLVETLAPEATVLTRGVCNKAGECSSETIAEALLQLQGILSTGQHVVVSLSLSAAPHPDEAIGIDDVVYGAIAYLNERYSDNLVITASAGNNGLDGDYHKNTPRLPSGLWNGVDAGDGKGARVTPLHNILSVGSVGLRTGSTFGYYSEAGYNPNAPFNLLAPSMRLCLPHPQGGCLPDGSNRGLSGTSFAAPLAAASAALYWEKCPRLTSAELVAFIPQNDNPSMSKDSDIPALSALPYKACPQAVITPKLTRNTLELHIGDSYDLHNLLDVDTPEAFAWEVSDNNVISLKDQHILHAIEAGNATLEVYHPSAPETRVALTVTITTNVCTDPPAIPDDALRRRMELRWNNGNPLTCELMAQQVRLFALGQDIRNLSGIEYAYNLTSVDLSDNPLGAQGDDVLAPLRQLPKLETLEIHNAGLRDSQLTPLKDIESLGWLSLHTNALTSIDSLAGANLPKLHRLWLYFNDIEDISPLGSLTSVQELFLHNNRIHDISALASLTQLNHLNIGNNPLANIDALARVTSLEELHIYKNGLDELTALENLENLILLRAFENNISDISPLRNLSNLYELSLWNNDISDISALQNMTLSILNISGNPIEDIAVLASMEAMETLSLAYTEVSNISVIQHMPLLTSLNIGGSNVKDISPLAQADNLEGLDMSALNLSDDDVTVLADKVSLQHLQLGSNRLTHAEFLRDLSALKSVSLFSNHLTDLSPLLTNQGINEDDLLTLTGNDWLLSEDTHLILEQIATLQERGVTIIVEDMAGLESDPTIMLQRTPTLSLNGYTPNNHNGRLANLWSTNLNDKDQHFEIFPIGSYRLLDESHNDKGVMLRRAGTTLCLSARPHNETIASFWRCSVDDAFQQWKILEQGDKVMLQLVVPANDTYFCLNAYNPIQERKVIMWACDSQDTDQLWDMQTITSAE